MQVVVYWAVASDILCTSVLLTESIRPIYFSGYDDCLVISVALFPKSTIKLHLHLHLHLHLPQPQVTAKLGAF